MVPAAGRGARFGGALPKQYVDLGGAPLIQRTLERVLSHPRIDAAMVALAPDDPHWPRLREVVGKPVFTCWGGDERADSVLAALQALPATVIEDDPVLVHDAARPCVRLADLDALLERGAVHAVGALLAAPVRDTLKRATAATTVAATQPREDLWRALTPQLFRRGGLTRALEAAARAGVAVTDEAMAMERLGLAPLLVEGAEDNIKVTTPADLAFAEFLLARH
ncbi:2-C-methyl-D-erythritol 4-phosphate cytidylyltransferase [Coralloluteibacterium stylophorae]|uniref:2-C-methyl-D-erythritol 4-phosphate cytidylyltransferase n=1 Tax=Coralloluteibacterium stylophorae TaxID=1776034 RepID=A0A8J8AXQ3_9GAMM|nr:2-C-methyl-D-erythritol 4-phosphate cytidylyltransferase [Coralloluteibacterium stylophorae]